MANLTKYVGTNLSDNQYKRLIEIAKERQKSIASIIRDALKQVYDIPPKDQKSIKEHNFVNITLPIQEMEKKEEERKKRLLNAFKKARGIWENNDEIDAIRKETNERWQEWQKELEKSA
jgi:hypothetical protein